MLGPVIDLHSHSTASDGSLSPADLVARAVKDGVSALALTDHDTVAGIDEALSAASAAGLRLVPGVELEISFAPGEFHLLGLELRDWKGPLAAVCAGLAESRHERNERIFDRMREAGIEGDYGELRDASGGVVGRPHIADWLVARKAAKNRQDAFDRYLGKHRPFWSPKSCLPLDEAVAAVKRAGGLAFVAHPMSLFVSWARLRLLFGEWKEYGVDGIEAWHPGAREGACARLEKLAREFGFRVSAGSDFHGPGRPERRLGRTAGGRKIDDAYLACLER